MLVTCWLKYPNNGYHIVISVATDCAMCVRSSVIYSTELYLRVCQNDNQGSHWNA